MDTYDNYLKISKTGRTGARQKLERSIKAGNRIYALLDTKDKRYERGAQSLFKDLPKVHIPAASDPGEDIDSAPVLITLPGEKSFFTTFLPQMCKTCLCMLIASPENAHDLSNFLRGRLEIKENGGEPFPFKFYDSQLARPFITALSVRRAAEFFGPVAALVWPEPDMRRKIRWYFCSFPFGKKNVSQSCEQDMSGQPYWEITGDEWKKFESNYKEDVALTDLCRELLCRDARLLEGLSDEEVRRKVRETVATAKSLGLHSKSDVYRFCKMELDSSPGIHFFPKFRAMLKNAAADDPHKMLSVMYFGERDWDELKQFSEKYLENPDSVAGLCDDENLPPVKCENPLFLDFKKRMEKIIPRVEKSRAGQKEEECGQLVFRHTEEISEGPDGFYLQAPYDYRHKWCEALTEPTGHAGLSVALYFRGGHLPEIQAAVCECIREYAAILGEKARCCVTPPGRLVIKNKRKLPIMDEEHVEKRQKRGESGASFMICSNATREEYKYKPPKCMLGTYLKLKYKKPFFWGKDNSGLPEDIPLDRQISYLFASFEPSMFGQDEPHNSFAELALRWVERLRPVSGTAGWGVTRPADWMLTSGASPFIAPYLLRYPGLGWIPDSFFSFIMDKFTEHITDINWLTIISDELAERIGGIEKIMLLGKDCPIARYPGGYVIQAGERPEYGDTEKGNSLPLYGKVQNLMRPLYLPLHHLDYVACPVLPPCAGPDFNPPVLGEEPDAKKYQHDYLEQWLHRFDENWKPENE